MNAIAEIEQLKAEFFKLTDENDLQAFKKRVLDDFDAKPEQEKQAFYDAFMKGAEEACDKAETLINYVNVKRKLNKVSDIIPLSYLSETYFGKSRSWLSQRLNGNPVDGSSASLTDKEMKILSDALNDISDKLKEVARSIA
ncbi:MAG: DUF5053 domain-containing protein [Tannerella sp.]|jgi:hypothetical protein|nr:DUF5053 domain-containing protein [Tannerella sp.]